MSHTTESRATRVWQPTSWGGLLIWLYLCLKSLEPFASTRGSGKTRQTGEIGDPYRIISSRPPSAEAGEPSAAEDGSGHETAQRPRTCRRTDSIAATAVNPVSVENADIQDTAEDMCLAIELKFLFPLLPYLSTTTTASAIADKSRSADAVPHACSPESSAQARQAHDLVAHIIRRKARQPAVTLHSITARSLQERDFWPTHWIVKSAASAAPRLDDPATADLSRLWVPVEVCSPKLPWRQQRHQQQQPAGGHAPAVTAVLRALRSAYGGAIAVNYTCDVHVHVGRADGCAFALGTCKRLATLLWLGEDVLRAVRDPASPNFGNLFTWGAAAQRHSRLAAEVDGGGDALAALWRAATHVELGRLMSGPGKQYRRLGFNFSSLGGEDERARRGPRTVEFRVMEGSLREEVVVPWTSVCGRLVEAAVEGSGGSGERFADVVRWLLREGDVGTDGAGAGDGSEVKKAEEKFGILMRYLGLDAGMVDTFLHAVFGSRSGRKMMHG